MTAAGCFIAFEGIDGSGKSTQVALLADRLGAAGWEVIATREPGGTPIGQAIRGILLDPANTSLDPRAEALLFAADRAQHVAEVIRPALARGAIVLGDRYLDSSVAYQGLARGLGEERVADLSAWATGGLTADLTVLLDLDPRTARDRRPTADRIEGERSAFHEQAAHGLRRRAQAAPDRFLVIPAGRPATLIAEEVHSAVGALLDRRGGRRR